jgi:hypothetical protein
MNLESDKINDYLVSDSIVNWKESSIHEKAIELISNTDEENAKIRLLYEWVRDNIPHSNDIGVEIVTCAASDVLKYKTGICFAKSHLLAAMLRAIKIPTGFCYQVLRLDTPRDNRLVLHGLNGVFVSTLDKWIRVDARGNTQEINAQFSIDTEQLAFLSDESKGEFIYDMIFAFPVKNVISKLLKYKKRSELWNDLPEPF